MAKNLDVLTAAVLLLIKAALLAAQFSPEHIISGQASVFTGDAFA